MIEYVWRWVGSGGCAHAVETKEADKEHGIAICGVAGDLRITFRYWPNPIAEESAKCKNCMRKLARLIPPCGTP